ncbi:hypothetical protein [Clostridium porci]|uniref:hypothetical protein n=1 Tax=Clostridium porci TaxID=2605778 RepID=UPI0012B3F3F9|nr:hypothetical protein [Clostridium porci]
MIVDYIDIKKNMNIAPKKNTNFESEEFEGVEQSIMLDDVYKDVLEQAENFKKYAK